jgi:hypothetical protein
VDAQAQYLKLYDETNKRGLAQTNNRTSNDAPSGRSQCRGPILPSFSLMRGLHYRVPQGRARFLCHHGHISARDKRAKGLAGRLVEGMKPNLRRSGRIGLHGISRRIKKRSRPRLIAGTSHHEVPLGFKHGFLKKLVQRHGQGP